MPVALRKFGGGAGLSPSVGAAGAALGAVGAEAAAGLASTGAGRGTGGGAIPPVERTTLERGAGAGVATGATDSPGATGADLVTESAPDFGGAGLGTGSGTTRTGATGSASVAGSATVVAAPDFAFFSGLGSSTIGSPRSSRLSASRRMRSADGSSMLDEWLFTPILSSSARSSTTWFSTPNSRASS